MQFRFFYDVPLRVFAHVVLALLVNGCSHSTPRNQNIQTPQDVSALQNEQIEKAEMERIIKDFCEDRGEIGESAWQRLQTYPRESLLKFLINLQDNLPKDDAWGPRIAFVLCNMGYEYEAHKELIAIALSETQKYKGFYADDAASLLGRLVQKGDKAVLQVLFKSASWSDASLSESLAETFYQELKTDFEKFLLQLKSQPISTRKRVYELIHNSNSFTREELSKLNSHLVSVPAQSPIYDITKELLKSPALKP